MIGIVLGIITGGWSKLLGVLGSLWSAAVANPAAALALILAGVSVFEWHELSVRSATIAKMTSAAAQYRKDLDADATSIKDQQAAIARQNLAVLQLGKDSAAAAASGDAADVAAVQRSSGRAALSAAIVPISTPAAPDCKTPDAVMAAQNQL